MAERIGIIGRGIAGLAAAFELRKAGFAVHIIGPARRDEPLGVATRAANGLSMLKGAVLPQKDLFASKAAGHAQLADWLADVERIAAGPRIPRLFRGASELIFDVKGYEGIRARVFHRKFTGCYRAEVIDFNKLNDRGGDLSELGIKAVGGFFYPRDGWCDADATLVALEAALRQMAVPFTDDCVESLAEHPQAGVEVRCEKGNLKCSEVVVAAGVWTDQILAASGIVGLAPQLAFAGETLRGRGDGEVVTSFAKTGLVACGGTIVYGASCYRAANLLDGPNPAKILELKEKVAARTTLPSFSEVLFGLRARAPDRLPTLGPLFFPSGNRRVWVLTGLYKSGLQLAPLFGRQLGAFLASGTAFGPFLPTRSL